VTALRTAAAAVIRAAAAADPRPQIYQRQAGTVTIHLGSARLDRAYGGRLIWPTR
jgi:hypothetical protein